MSNEPHRQLRRSAWEQLVRCDPAIVGTPLLVGLVAASYGDRDGTQILVSVETLAANIGATRPTVQRALKHLKDSHYLTQVRRGHHRWDGSTVASEHRLAIPQRLTGDALMPVDNPLSIAHQRAVECFSTSHLDPLNESFEGTQGVTSEALPSLPISPGSAAATSCGRCHPVTHLLEEPVTRRPTTEPCPNCHPSHNRKKSPK